MIMVMVVLKVYDKNGKAFVYTHNSILTKRRSQKTNKQ